MFAKKSCANACLLLLFALMPCHAAADWTAAAFLGRASTADADIHVTNLNTDVTFHDVRFDDRSFQSPPYYGYRVGFAFKPAAGVEGEFIHMKAFARVNAPVLQQYNVSHGLNLVLANFVSRQRLADRFAVALRAGSGFAVPHAEIRAFGEAVDEYQVHGAVFQVAAGLEAGLSRRVFVIAEYKITATRQRFEAGDGVIGNTFRTQHVIGGVGFRF